LLLSRRLRKDFECHETAEPDILRLIDHTHTASAELLDDAVLPKRLTDEGGRHESPLRMFSVRSK
jgi:hypothetical protein